MEVDAVASGVRITWTLQRMCGLASKPSSVVAP
jgi:hypothetical protein